MTGFDQFPFGARGSFAGVPRSEIADLEAGSVAVVGAPFDWGTTHRPGARFGPKAIRDADYLYPTGSRPHLDSGVDALEVLGVVDVGDVGVIPGYVEESIERIRSVVTAIVEREAVPVILGGDHTIAFPGAGGVADVVGHGSVALIHFDAHADTAPDHFGMLHGHGTPMRRLIESGAVPGSRFAQIGLRGYWPPPEVVDWMADQGIHTFPMSDVSERGLEAVLADALATAGEGAAGIYVSVDIDVVDPGAAPGTGTPEPGGLTPRQLLDAVRRLGRELPVVGADVVEVSPAYDSADVTALLANRVVLELLGGMADRRLQGG